MLYKVVLSFKSVYETPECDHSTIQIKAIEQYCHVVLLIMLYKVILTLKSLYEALVYDHSSRGVCSKITCTNS